MKAPLIMSLLIKRHQWSDIQTESAFTPDRSNLSSRSSTADSSSNSSENSIKPVRHLFLVRHGQYQRERTQSDGHLTFKGQKQAFYVANFLISQLPDNVLFDSLTHSDMIRTRETASIIYKQLKLMNKVNVEYYSIDTDFREHNFLFGFLIEGNSEIIVENVLHSILSGKGNWRALKRDYFRLKKNSQTTFEIIVAHRNIIGHCIELLTTIRPDKSIAFNTSVTHIVVDHRGVIVDYAYKHDFLPIDLLTMWEIFLPQGVSRVREHEYVHCNVNGVTGEQRKGCCIRLFIACLR